MTAMQTPEQVALSLRQFLEDNFLGMRPGLVIDGTTPLLASGIVDSMGVLELLSYLEGTFGVIVEDDEVVEANLGTLDDLVRFVATKQRHAAELEAR